MSLRPSRVVTTVALALLGILGMLLAALFEGPSRLVAGDAHYVFAAARSLAYDGDLDLTNQYWVMGDRWGLGRDPATDGWRLPARELGASLLMMPGLWLHYLIGLSPRWEPACACLLGAASLGPCWLGCVKAIEAWSPSLARNEGSHVELLAAAVVFGSVVPYYAIGSPGYSHAPDAAICAWLCWALLDRRGPILVGVLLACAVLTRMQNLLWVLWPLCEWLRPTSASAEREGTGTAARVLVIAGIGLLGFAPQLWLGLAHPGSVRGSLGWTWAFFDLDDLARDLARVLVGVHGLLRWTPIAAVAIVGLWLERRRNLAAITVAIAMCFLFAIVRDVDGGDAFGARRTAGLVALLGLGLAQLFSAPRPRPEPGALPARLWARLDNRRIRIALGLVLAITVAANLVRTQQAIVGELSLVSPDRSPGHR